MIGSIQNKIRKTDRPSVVVIFGSKELGKSGWGYEGVDGKEAVTLLNFSPKKSRVYRAMMLVSLSSSSRQWRKLARRRVARKLSLNWINDNGHSHICVLENFIVLLRVRSSQNCVILLLFTRRLCLRSLREHKPPSPYGLNDEKFVQSYILIHPPALNGPWYVDPCTKFHGQDHYGQLAGGAVVYKERLFAPSMEWRPFCGWTGRIITISKLYIDRYCCSFQDRCCRWFRIVNEEQSTAINIDGVCAGESCSPQLTIGLVLLLDVFWNRHPRKLMINWGGGGGGSTITLHRVVTNKSWTLNDEDQKREKEGEMEKKEGKKWLEVTCSSPMEWKTSAATPVDDIIPIDFTNGR